MTKFTSPLILADLINKPLAPAEGFVKFYVNATNLKLLRTDGVERDVVLDRTLEAYKKASAYRAITPQDTVKRAIELLEAKQGGGASFLEKDVKAQGTDVGGVLDGQTLFEGMSLTEIIVRMLTKRQTQGYGVPTAAWTCAPYRPYWEVGFRVDKFDIAITFSQNDGGEWTSADISHNGTSVSSGLTYTMPGYFGITTPTRYSGFVNYAAGAAKPDNFGVIDPDDPQRIQAGRADPGVLEWRGVYPWFYGVTDNPGGPDGATIYASAGKVIEPVGSVLDVPTFGSGINFLWFAVPAGTPAFKSWYRTVLNQAQIGTPQDLFNAAKRVLVPSTGLALNWIQDYDLYVTNYATGSVDPMRLSPGKF